MDTIRTRKHPLIRHLRRLGGEGDYRREQGEFLCDGMKLLREALDFGARVTGVFWKEEALPVQGLEAEEFVLSGEIYDYASPMINSPGPLFTVSIPEPPSANKLQNALVLENVQDPGNVGTVIRSANAFGIGAVILVGDCADLYHPKTVRATMGAIFRQRVLRLRLEELDTMLKEQGLPLYGAALHRHSLDLRQVPVKRAAVAVGSEGRGLSEALIMRCESSLIIPISENSESLNAAVAAAVIMWEMAR